MSPSSFLIPPPPYAVDDDRVGTGRKETHDDRRERLARRLDACAAMVRRSERGRFLETTIGELIDYCNESPPVKKPVQQEKIPNGHKRYRCLCCEPPPQQQQQPSWCSMIHESAFQRPHDDSTSNVLAAGWIQQQQRIKGRPVWRQVFMSIVEGQKVGEETTLFIYQRDDNHVNNDDENKADTTNGEYRVNHRIPVRFFENVVMVDVVGHQFALHISHLEEEFVFQCPHDGYAAQNWVATLVSVMEIAQKRSPQSSPDVFADPPNAAFRDEHKVEHPSSFPTTQHYTPTTTTPPKDGGKRMSISELRAIAHGAGISTIGMERRDLERAVADLYATRPPPSAPPRTGETDDTIHRPPRDDGTTPLVDFSSDTISGSTFSANDKVPFANAPGSPSPGAGVPQPPQEHHSSFQRAPSTTVPTQPIPFSQMKIRDLRAIAHGVGISTIGMERRDLEKAVAEAYGCPSQPPSASSAAANGQVPQYSSLHEQNGTQTTSSSPPPADARPGSGAPFPSESNARPVSPPHATNSHGTDHQKTDTGQPAAASVSGAGSPFVSAANADPSPAHPQQHPPTENSIRPRISIKELRAVAHGVGINTIGMERHELEAAVAKAYSRHQDGTLKDETHPTQPHPTQTHPTHPTQPHPTQAHPTQAHPSQTHPSQTQYTQAHHQQAHYTQAHGNANNQWYQSQQQNQHQQNNPWQYQPNQVPPNFSGHPQPQQNAQGPFPAQQQTHPSDPATFPPFNQTETAIQSREKFIKQGVLVQWALQPPMFRALRPITVLLSTIHTVFPPRFGIVKHAHFMKWKGIQISDLCDTNGRPVDAKLEKARRRLSLVIHEDKYPTDFSNEHKILCQLLWAVINDAFDAATY